MASLGTSLRTSSPPPLLRSSARTQVPRTPTLHATDASASPTPSSTTLTFKAAGSSTHTMPPRCETKGFPPGGGGRLRKNDSNSSLVFEEEVAASKFPPEKQRPSSSSSPSPSLHCSASPARVRPVEAQQQQQQQRGASPPAPKTGITGSMPPRMPSSRHVPLTASPSPAGPATQEEVVVEQLFTTGTPGASSAVLAVQPEDLLPGIRPPLPRAAEDFHLALASVSVPAPAPSSLSLPPRTASAPLVELTPPPLPLPLSSGSAMDPCVAATVLGLEEQCTLGFRRLEVASRMYHQLARHNEELEAQLSSMRQQLQTVRSSLIFSVRNQLRRSKVQLAAMKAEVQLLLGGFQQFVEGHHGALLQEVVRRIEEGQPAAAAAAALQQCPVWDPLLFRKEKKSLARDQEGQELSSSSRSSSRSSEAEAEQRYNQALLFNHFGGELDREGEERHGGGQHPAAAGGKRKGRTGTSAGGLQQGFEGWITAATSSSRSPAGEPHLRHPQGRVAEQNEAALREVAGQHQQVKEMKLEMEGHRRSGAAVGRDGGCGVSPPTPSSSRGGIVRQSRENGRGGRTGSRKNNKDHEKEQRRSTGEKSPPPQQHHHPSRRMKNGEDRYRSSSTSSSSSAVLAPLASKPSPAALLPVQSSARSFVSRLNNLSGTSGSPRTLVLGTFPSGSGRWEESGNAEEEGEPQRPPAPSPNDQFLRRRPSSSASFQLPCFPTVQKGGAKAVAAAGGEEGALEHGCSLEEDGTCMDVTVACLQGSALSRRTSYYESADEGATHHLAALRSGASRQGGDTGAGDTIDPATSRSSRQRQEEEQEGGGLPTTPQQRHHHHHHHPSLPSKEELVVSSRRPARRTRRSPRWSAGKVSPTRRIRRSSSSASPSPAGSGSPAHLLASPSSSSSSSIRSALDEAVQKHTHQQHHGLGTEARRRSKKSTSLRQRGSSNCSNSSSRSHSAKRMMSRGAKTNQLRDLSPSSPAHRHRHRTRHTSATTTSSRSSSGWDDGRHHHAGRPHHRDRTPQHEQQQQHRPRRTTPPPSSSSRDRSKPRRIKASASAHREGEESGRAESALVFRRLQLQLAETQKHLVETARLHAFEREQWEERLEQIKEVYTMREATLTEELALLRGYYERRKGGAAPCPTTAVGGSNAAATAEHTDPHEHRLQDGEGVPPALPPPLKRNVSAARGRVVCSSSAPLLSLAPVEHEEHAKDSPSPPPPPSAPTWNMKRVQQRGDCGVRLDWEAVAAKAVATAAAEDPVLGAPAPLPSKASTWRADAARSGTIHDPDHYHPMCDVFFRRVAEQLTAQKQNGDQQEKGGLQPTAVDTRAVAQGLWAEQIEYGALLVISFVCRPHAHRGDKFYICCCCSLSHHMPFARLFFRHGLVTRRSFSVCGGGGRQLLRAPTTAAAGLHSGHPPPTSSSPSAPPSGCCSFDEKPKEVRQGGGSPVDSISGVSSRAGMDGYTDAGYNAAADGFIEQLECALDQLEHDAIEEVFSDAGVLTINVGQRGTFVLNKQAPKLQLWLSSPLSGPHHYDYVATGEGGDAAVQWRCDHDQHNLKELLEKELSEVLGITMVF
eukprot:gene3811-2697_t